MIWFQIEITFIILLVKNICYCILSSGYHMMNSAVEPSLWEWWWDLPWYSSIASPVDTIILSSPSVRSNQATHMLTHVKLVYSLLWYMIHISQVPVLCTVSHYCSEQWNSTTTKRTESKLWICLVYHFDMNLPLPKIFCIIEGTPFFLRKGLFTGTVSVNKAYLTGTVPVNKMHLTGTVPVNKTYLTGTLFQSCIGNT